MKDSHDLYVCMDWDFDKGVEDVLFLRLGTLPTIHGGYTADCYVGLMLEKMVDEGDQPCFQRVGRW